MVMLVARMVLYGLLGWVLGNSGIRFNTPAAWVIVGITIAVQILTIVEYEWKKSD